jgi:hypothetical protein
MADLSALAEFLGILSFQPMVVKRRFRRGFSRIALVFDEERWKELQELDRDGDIERRPRADMKGWAEAPRVFDACDH